MNHFAFESAAIRYDKGRPYFQPQVIELIREKLTLEKSLDSALDVACGTGHSTVALKAIANKVAGTDLSTAMIKQLDLAAGIETHVAAAEVQPFADQSFDLITVCMAYHWFDQSAFLAEARRLLKPQAHLAIYNALFPGVMRGNDAYRKAHFDYLAQFPTPTRHERYPTPADAIGAGFDGEKFDFSFWATWTLAELVDYLCTQSSVIDQVEKGQQTLEQVQDYLNKTFAPFFSQEAESFRFDGALYLAQCE